MCRNCHCENEMKCSVKGYQPEGWCCEHCDLYDSERLCIHQASIEPSGHHITGFCMGCQKEGAPLVWVYLRTPRGMCRDCFIKNSKEKANNISKIEI